MRDMMANHDRLESHSAGTGDAVRKAAAATFEALPALLLAAALLMPALAAFAAPDAEREPHRQPNVDLSRVIAMQGNQALADIRADARESVRNSLTLPQL